MLRSWDRSTSFTRMHMNDRSDHKLAKIDA